MKLAKYRDANGDHWGEIDPDAGTIRRIADPFTEWAPEVTANGPGVLRFDDKTVKLDSVKLLAPLHRPAHIYWLGLNYPNWPKPEDTDASVFRSEEHTSELQSLMRNSYAVFCLKHKHTHNTTD